jgi:hypothetical protein
VDKAQQAVALPTASRLHRACTPFRIKNKAETANPYTGSCQQRIDSLRVADLTPLQAHTSFGKDYIRFGAFDFGARTPPMGAERQFPSRESSRSWPLAGKSF